MKSPRRRNTEQAFVSRLTLFGSWVARRSSLRAGWRVADTCAYLVIHLVPGRQRMADANIAAAFPEMSPRERYLVRRDSVRNICRTMMELLRLPAMTPEDLKSLVKVDDLEPLATALADGRGALIVSAHYGNWEWLGARLAADLEPMTAIARDAAHGTTASLINLARESHGMKVIGREDLREMVRVLRSGKMLGIVPDQHALQGGELLEFMGRPAWTFTGPALLAARTGAHVFPCFCVRNFSTGDFTLEIGPEVEMLDSGDRPADLIANTRRITAAIEQAIRRHPEQWLWLHDRWKSVSRSQTTDQ